LIFFKHNFKEQAQFHKLGHNWERYKIV